MANFAISGAAGNLTSVAHAAASLKATTQPAPTAKPAPVLQPNTLKLSPAAQARLMHRQGQSVALIAASLGTSVASVDGYLNIKVAAQAAAPVAAPTPQAAPAAKPANAPTAAPPSMSGKN